MFLIILVWNKNKSTKKQKIIYILHTKDHFKIGVKHYVTNEDEEILKKSCYQDKIV